LEVVLTQKDEEEQKYVITNPSKSNNNIDTNYLSYEEEAFVAIWAII